MRKKICVILMIVICCVALISIRSVSAGTMQVSYRTHVQNIGWQGFVKNGVMSGTSGRSLRLEGINIKLENQPYTGNIEYCTHVQNIGWQGFVKNGEMSGTTGKSLRLEAIKIRLTGELANHYDVYYRVHCQNIGWMNWAKNGESAGSAGYSLRLEGIEIVVVNKGSNPPTRSNIDYNKAFKCHQISYRTHVQNIGWQNYVYDGEMAGTSGRSLRLEGINIKLENQPYSGNIEYCTHVQNIGWQNFVKNGAMSGTSGRSLRLEAIKIRLTGEMANHYDIYYRVHCQNIGWMDWAKNGESAGTAGYSYRLEAINIALIEKGGKAPGKTSNCFKDFYNNKSEYKINYENLNKLKKSNNIDVYVYQNSSFPIILESYTENYFVEFTSSNTNIAKVDNAGNITGISAGKTKVTMNFRNKKNKQLIETCFANVNVENEYKINYEALKKAKSTECIDIAVNWHEAFPNVVEMWNDDNYSVEYISSNPNVVKVDSCGNMSGVKVGKAKVTMNFKDRNKNKIIESCFVNVNIYSYEIPEPKKRDYTLVINPSNVEVEVDKIVHVDCIFSKENINEDRISIREKEGNGKCCFSSWDGWVKNGFDIFGQEEGTKKFEIWDSDYGEVIATFNVTIKPRTPVSGVYLETTNILGHPNFAYEIKFVVVPEGAVNKRVIWSSSNPDVAVASRYKEGMGLIDIKKPGSAIITVTTEEGGYSATCNVISTEIPAESIQISKTNKEIKIGEEYQLTAVVMPNNASNRSVKWSSSNDSIVTVSDTGKIKGIKKGNAIIYAETADGGFKAECRVTVVKPILNASCNVGYAFKTISNGTSTIAQQGINVTTSVSGGTGEYTYSIKLYKDDTLIGETDEKELFVTGYKSGTYTAKLTVTDSDGEVKNVTSTVTITIGT